MPLQESSISHVRVLEQPEAVSCNLQGRFSELTRQFDLTHVTKFERLLKTYKFIAPRTDSS
jgi:hypothetical protein